jgi:hypothetical protein
VLAIESPIASARYLFCRITEPEDVVFHDGKSFVDFSYDVALIQFSAKRSLSGTHRRLSGLNIFRRTQLLGRLLLGLLCGQPFRFPAPGRAFPHVISAAIVSHVFFRCYLTSSAMFGAKF